MLWRSLLVVALLLSIVQGVIAATRDSDLPLTTSLLIRRDNGVYRVSFTGNLTPLFEPDEGDINRAHVSINLDAVFVAVRTDTHSELYRVEYDTSGEAQLLFSDEPAFFYFSPDERHVAYTIRSGININLVIRDISGEKFREFTLEDRTYQITWNNDDTLMLRNSNAEIQLLVDLREESVQEMPFEPFILDLTMSPDEQWDIIRETADNTTNGPPIPYYLLNRFTQEKTFIRDFANSPRPDVTWSLDSQWAVIFPRSAEHRLYIYHIPTRTLKALNTGNSTPFSGNVFRNEFTDRSPMWPNWSFDNEWILFSTVTKDIGRPDSRTYFSIIHRDGNNHFPRIIGVDSMPEQQFQALWLPPEAPQEINWPSLVSVMATIFVTGFALRLYVRRRGLQS